MSDNDWDIPGYILEGDNCTDDYLNNYKNRINMLNGIAKGRAVTTRANRKLQVDALKKALGLNHKRNIDEFVSPDNDDFTKDNSSSNLNNSSSEKQSKGLPGEKSLPDKYFCEGSPSKLMMEALKELNINDIKDFLMAGGPKKPE